MTLLSIRRRRLCQNYKKCHQRRHTGAGRYPELTEDTGFRIKYGMTKELFSKTSLIQLIEFFNRSKVMPITIINDYPADRTGIRVNQGNERRDY